MAENLSHSLVLNLIIFQTVLLLVVLSNIRLLHQARRHGPPPAFPKVSMMVPARNEENTITGCIQSLLAQDYPSFEVLVLDDQSSDRTRFILDQIANSYPTLKVLVGKPPPDGLAGKNWACVQLAQQAQGDLLFFTDADTLHHPQTLRASVTALLGTGADLLTGFPRQEVRSWGERLIVPFFSWAVLCFVPLELAYRLRLPALSCAVGQMLLFRRQAYEAIGGHGRLGLSIVDDLSLARQIKAAGLRWRVFHVADLISCRMYPNSREAFHGMVKNLFAAFGFRLLPYSFVFIWLAVMFWEPLIVLGLLFLGQAPQARANELAACIGISLLLWLLPYLELGVPIRLAFLYPLTILATEVVAFQSLRLSLAGRLTWKGRKLPKSHWKLL
jgi:chlorobactene glucosyltransferase